MLFPCVKHFTSFSKAFIGLLLYYVISVQLKIERFHVSVQMFILNEYLYETHAHMIMVRFKLIMYELCMGNAHNLANGHYDNSVSAAPYLV